MSDNPHPGAEIQEPNDTSKSGPKTSERLRNVEDQMTSFERASVRFAWLTFCVSVLAAIFVGLQWVAMRETLDEMKRSGNTATEQLWRAIGNMNWMARTADGALHQSEQAMEANDRQSRGALAVAVRSSKEQQRAWVVPKGAVFKSGLPAAGKPILLDISYDNVGREPALDSHGIFRFHRISESAFADNSVNSIIEGTNICKGIPEKIGADVVYSNAGGYTLQFKTPQDWVTQESIDSKQAIVFQMCIAYKTMGEVHRTSFCYWYRPSSTEPGQLNICTAGNHAD